MRLLRKVTKHYRSSAKVLAFVWGCLILGPSSALLISYDAYAEATRAKLTAVPLRAGEKMIPKLSWNETLLRVARISFPIEEGENEEDLTALITGSFTEPDWSVMMNKSGKAIPLSANSGSFSVRVPLKKGQAVLHVYAISPLGAIYTQRFLIRSDNWLDLNGGFEDEAIESDGRSYWNTGLGFTYFHYNQATVRDFSGLMLNSKLFYQYWIEPDEWDLSLGGYFSLLPLYASQSNSSIRFLGINARVGYTIPWSASQWRLTLMGGYYYATTIGDFGYKDAGGPMLYPMVTRALPNATSLSAYIKFSPMFDGVLPLALSNREIAGGLTYNFPTNLRGAGYSLQADFANLALDLGTLQVSSTTYSLGMGFHW